MFRHVKHFLSLLIPDTLKGRLDYYRFPEDRLGFGGPLNGSLHRQQVVEWLVGELPVQVLIETGTYFGTTTEYLGRFGLPVYSSEIDARKYGFARQRLSEFTNIELMVSDSRRFLDELAGRRSVPKQHAFFYLDAHWGKDLPLEEELDIIRQGWSQSVIMIDDFKVPDDPGYGYDDYGLGKVLDCDLLMRAGFQPSHIFFPAAKSEDEIGVKRGWVILGLGDEVRALLSKSSLLRAYDADQPTLVSNVAE